MVIFNLFSLRTLEGCSSRQEQTCTFTFSCRNFREIPWKSLGHTAFSFWWCRSLVVRNMYLHLRRLLQQILRRRLFWTTNKVHSAKFEKAGNVTFFARYDHSVPVFSGRINSTFKCLVPSKTLPAIEQKLSRSGKTSTLRLMSMQLCHSQL